MDIDRLLVAMATDLDYWLAMVTDIWAIGGYCYWPRLLVAMVTDIDYSGCYGYWSRLLVTMVTDLDYWLAMVTDLDYWLLWLLT